MENTTEHTMGKRMQAGDAWHFDIQHIKAPTAFLRAWYRSRLRMEHPGKEFQFTETRNDSLIFYKSNNYQIAFFFKQIRREKFFTPDKCSKCFHSFGS